MPNKFVIAIASGKGGMGKTTIATNLASCIADLCRNVQYLDCNVEEPNDHRITDAYSVEKMIIDTLPQYRKHLDNLHKNILNKLVGRSYEKR